MAEDANSPRGREDPGDAAALERHAEALADAIEAAIPVWIERSVLGLVDAAGLTVDDRARAVARDAARAAAAEGAPAARELLRTDVDEQRTTPLTVLRGLVPHATAALRELGVPPVHRDRFDSEAFPDDDYGLTPAAFADVDPSLHEPGIVWGAAKAHVHIRRHKPT